MSLFLGGGEIAGASGYVFKLFVYTCLGALSEGLG